MATRMQQRRGTAEQWTTADPILAAGEIGFETDTNQFKIGDGVNAWSELSYFKNLEDLGGSLDDYILLTDKGVANGVATLNSQGRIPLSQLADLINNAPDALNTINELADAITMVDGSLSGHNETTLNIHGIPNTAELVTNASLDLAIDGVSGSLQTHTLDTTDVHGIADTSQLVTSSNLNTAVSDALTTAAADASTKATDAQTAAGVASSLAISDHNLDKTNVHGITNTDDLVYTSDSRLSDARTPSDASVTDAKIVAGGLSQSSITDLSTDLAAKASLASPSLSGTPTAPTATSGDNSTKVATTAYVDSAVAALVASAPAALDTLNELALAINSDADFSSTIISDLATKITQQDLDAATLVNFNAQTTSYTLVLADNTNLVEMDSSSANTVTIPADSAEAFPVGSAIDIFQRGTGQTTLVAGSGVTLLYTPGLKLRARYSAATAVKRAANTWIVTGDLTV